MYVRFDARAFVQWHSGKQTGAVEEDAAVAMPSACLVNIMTTAARWPLAYGRHSHQRTVARLQPARSALLSPFQGPATLLRLREWELIC